MILIGENTIRYATQLAFWADTITGTDIHSILFTGMVLCGMWLAWLSDGLYPLFTKNGG